MPLSTGVITAAADLVNVAPRSVKDARVVLAHATPEVIAKVERGELAVSKAAREIREATPRPVKQKPVTVPSAAPRC